MANGNPWGLSKASKFQPSLAAAQLTREGALPRHASPDNRCSATLTSPGQAQAVNRSMSRSCMRPGKQPLTLSPGQFQHRTTSSPSFWGFSAPRGVHTGLHRIPLSRAAGRAFPDQATSLPPAPEPGNSGLATPFSEPSLEPRPSSLSLAPNRGHPACCGAWGKQPAGWGDGTQQSLFQPSGKSAALRDMRRGLAGDE